MSGQASWLASDALRRWPPGVLCELARYRAAPAMYAATMYVACRSSEARAPSGGSHGGSRVGVRGSFLDVAQWYSGIESGSERFTNHAEYVKLRTGDMRSLVLVGASLPLPQLHQAVT